MNDLKIQFNQEYTRLRKLQELIEKIDYALLGETTDMKYELEDLRRKTTAERDAQDELCRKLAMEYVKSEKYVNV